MGVFCDSLAILFSLALSTLLCLFFKKYFALILIKISVVFILHCLRGSFTVVVVCKCSVQGVFLSVCVIIQ